MVVVTWMHFWMYRSSPVEKEASFEEYKNYYIIQQKEVLDRLNTEREAMIKPYMDGIPDGIVLGAYAGRCLELLLFAQKTMYEQRIEQKRIEDDQRGCCWEKFIEDQKKKDAGVLRIKKELDAKNKQIEAEKKIRDERAKEIAPYVIFIRDYKRDARHGRFSIQKRVIGNQESRWRSISSLKKRSLKKKQLREIKHVKKKGISRRSS